MLKRLLPLVLTLSLFASFSTGVFQTTSSAASTHHSLVDPIRLQPHADQVIWVCLLAHESHSTIRNPNMGDQWGIRGDYGPLQIAPVTWNRWAPYVYVAPTLLAIQTASFITEQKVAIEIQKEDGWGPWHGDGCV